MKLNGTIINGLFQFVKGVPYTKGDLLIWLNTELGLYDLYIVQSDYSGDVTPDRSESCVPYIKFHEYSEKNTGDEAIITAASLKMILKDYFKGLKGGGELESIKVSSDSDLDNFTSLGAYKLTTEDSLSVLSDGTYLFKVSRLEDNIIIQEFIKSDLKVQLFRLIRLSDGKVKHSEWKVGYAYSETKDILSDHITDLSKRLALISESIGKVKSNYYNFEKLETVPGNRDSQYVNYTVNGVKVGQVLHLIITDIDKTNGTDNYQYSEDVLITAEGKTSIKQLTKDCRIEVRYSSQGTNILLTNNQYNLSIAYASN